MLVMAGSKMTDPIRAYIYTLRRGRRLSQNAVAAGAGIKRRTYIAWENGETEKLEVGVAQALVTFLGGAWEHLRLVQKMEPQAAAILARGWLAMSPEEQAASLSKLPTEAQFRELIAIAADDPKGLAAVLRDLRNDARADPRVLDLTAAYLQGLRSGLHTPEE